MDNFSEATIYQHQAMSVKIAQFLRGTVAVILVGGVMYAAALVAHREERVAPTPVASVASQQ